MILAFIGLIMVVIAVGEGNVPVVITGAVLAVVGLILSKGFSKYNQARGNQIEYWAKRKRR